MPYYKGVFAASLLLIVCLGTNMSAFPEVWRMFSHDTPTEVAVLPATTPDSVSEPDKAIPATPKSVKTDKPIPIDPPAPKKEELAPALKKEEPVPEPKKEEPLPEPKKEEPLPEPKKEEPLQEPKKEEPLQEPRKEESVPEPKKEAPIQEPKDNVAKGENDRSTAFAPIVPIGLQSSGKLESLLPKSETAGPFSVKLESAPETTPSYAAEFKPQSGNVQKQPVSTYETVDSVLAQPIVYESHPTIDQRIEGHRRVVPLPPSTGSSLRPLTAVSPTGPVRRLPPTN